MSRAFHKASALLHSGQRVPLAVSLLKRAAASEATGKEKKKKKEEEEEEEEERGAAWAARACNALANIYLEGRFVPRDAPQARRYLLRAAALGSEAASVQLALLGDGGISETRGLRAAVCVGRREAALASTVPLAEYYCSVVGQFRKVEEEEEEEEEEEKEEGEEQEEVDSSDWKAPLRTGARAGLAGAQLRLGLSLLPREVRGRVHRATLGVPDRLSEAQWGGLLADARQDAGAGGVEWIFKAAARGFARAVFVAGKLLLCLPVAVASEQEHLVGCAAGGMAPERGSVGGESGGGDDEHEHDDWRDVNGDVALLSQGYSYVLHAARAGDAEAQFQLGLWHEETIDRESMDARGVLVRNVIQRTAACPSSSSAMPSGMPLGMPVFGGQFDDNVAIQWYVAAVENSSSHCDGYDVSPARIQGEAPASAAGDRGHAGALVRLARLIERGRGSGDTPDLELAAECYKRAARLGSVGAMHCLGRLHVMAVGKETSAPNEDAALSRQRAAGAGGGGGGGGGNAENSTRSSLHGAAWTPNLSEGVGWFERAGRTGRSPVSAFCAGLALERMADSTVRRILEGPNQAHDASANECMGFELAERAASMFAMCAEDAKRLATEGEIGFAGFGGGPVVGGVTSSSPEPIYSVALYRFAMVLLRWPPPIGEPQSSSFGGPSPRRQMVRHAVQLLTDLAGDVDEEGDSGGGGGGGGDNEDDEEGYRERGGRRQTSREKNTPIVVRLAAHALATLYMEGVLAPRSAEQGFGDAPALLAPSVPLAMEWFRKAAIAGNGNASFALADLFEYGGGGALVRPDPEMSRAWYACAARQLLGNHDNITSSRSRGSNNKNNSSKSDNSAFDGGNPGVGLLDSFDAESEYIRGILYMSGMHGRGSGPDQARAVKWFRRSAHHRNPQAMFTLAWMTVQQIKKKDINASSKSVRLHRNAALRSLHAASMEGHEESSRTIGMMYAQGLGVLPDRAKAAAWSRVAQEQSKTWLLPETVLWRLGGRFM
jgi:TPR repeat protein